MKATRRMGPKNSDIWNNMLDAAEDILRKEGYGELTSRHVADRISVKQRLVYYYFQTMDELIVETFQRLAVRELERLTNAMASHHTLRETWDICVHTTDTRLISEFMALANHSAALRKKVKKHIETCRDMHVAALTKAMRGSRIKNVLPPEAAAIFATSAALTVHREKKIGVNAGHAEVMGVINAFISKLDPEE